MNDFDFTKEELDELVQQSRESQRRQYREGLKTPITVKCVVCDVEIPDSFPEIEKDELAEEYAEHTSFANGAVGVISFGFGSRHDTKVLIIGLCENCYDKKVETGSVLFTRSYMP